MTWVTTALEILGVLLIVGFCVVVWWPAALLVGGVSLLVMSWSLTPKASKPPNNAEIQ